ncbi:neutral/alkaline non-lysosomal ceramidase N-terminal domain-containing protein [Nocardioides ginsengisoli]|uniref:Neutral/alkaline non-lysosomal ceramidase N-terminal domain-containing protein n=1 Tax=Nocardioides ginsengisoli TaxID=363868 RepID=A0ABW3W5F9_9ACTN
MNALRAGAASVDLRAPVGVDLVGFLRRHQANEGNNQALEAGVLVLDDGHSRAVIVSIDTGSIVRPFADHMRERIAEAAGAGADAVFINASHTHAAPPLPGHIKTGGSTAEPTPAEMHYARAVLEGVEAAAAQAARGLVPVRLGHRRTSFDGGVNRRQRTDDGGTIMGWNPDGFRDTSLDVVRIETDSGTTLATLISYGCHPVVLGPDLNLACADFVAPMRREVRASTGGECLFLQGCAGNVFPLEGLFAEPGPEITFGKQMARRALGVFDDAQPWEVTHRGTVMQSASPMALWRSELVPGAGQAIAVAQRDVELKLQVLPTLAEAGEVRRGLEERLADLQARKRPRTEWNSVWLHLEWATRVEQSLTDGTATDRVLAPIGALTVGPLTVVTLPCEPFAEIGAEIKRRVSGDLIVLGYTNHMVGYVPTREEFAWGGYEPWLAPRHFGQPAPFDPGTADLLIQEAVAAAQQTQADAAARCGDAHPRSPSPGQVRSDDLTGRPTAWS